MREDNIFAVGSEVTGESFFGRRGALVDLRRRLCGSGRSKGLSITGPNRIGKTSLIQKLADEDLSMLNGTLLVKMSMESCSSASAFLLKLAMELKQEITQKGIRDETVQEKSEKLIGYDTREEREYMRYNQDLLSLLGRLKALSWRVILIIDEFDCAGPLFTQQYYFGLLRTISSSAEYSVTVVLISRRKLYMIERSSDEMASKFHGVFDTFQVSELPEEDMDDFWAALSQYDIFKDEQLCQELRHYAGTHPYLLSFYGNRMAQAALEGRQVTAETVAEINRKERAWVERYYFDLSNRLEADNHLEKLIGILFGPCIDVSPADVRLLDSLGYLREQEDGTCCCFCQDFMEYLQRLHINVPMWDGILGAERTLKGFVNERYPELEKMRWSTLSKHPNWPNIQVQDYPEQCQILQIKDKEKLKTIVRNLKNNYNWYGRDTTVVDVLELNKIKQIIINDWKKFAELFNCRSSKEQIIWENKLDLIVLARLACAHDHSYFLKQKEKDLVQIYCQEVRDLVK